MIKNKGNFKEATKELKKSSSTAHLYSKESKISGPLSGTTITIKDLYSTSDAPTQASSKILEGFNSGYDAEIVKKIKAAGATIIAKVHLDELALGGTGQFNAYSKIDNPLNKDRIIGGSSSGSAATFTKSIGLSIGSDTGDSIRLPASYNGLYGFKPSYGAISRYGQFAYASSLDTVGYFAHNVHDIIEISNVLFGVDKMDMTSRRVEKPEHKIIKPKIIGFIKNSNGVPKYLLNQYEILKKQFKKDEIEIIEFEIDQILLDNIDVVYQAISYSEASSNDSNLTGISFGVSKDGKDWNEIMHNTRSKLFGELVQRRFTLGAYFLSNENLVSVFQKSQKVRRLIVDAFNNIKNQVDLFVFPATTIAPLKTEKKLSTWLNSILINSNFSGAPSLVIPWGTHENMPFGLAMEASLYEDKKLLSHALYVEKLLGGDNE